VSEDPSISDACDAVEALLSHFRDEIIPAINGLPDPEPYVVQIAFLARAVSLIEATVKLARDGYGREAMMLNRASFELTVDALWAAADPKRTEEHFVAYARFSQQLMRDNLSAWPEFGEPSEERLDEDELKQHAKRFGKYGERGWTGQSIKSRLDSLEPDFDEEQQKGWRFAYEVVQRWNNAELHPSVWSLARALRRVPSPQGGQRLQFRPTSEPELSPLALQVAWWLFVQHLSEIHESLNLGSETLQAVADAGAAQVKLVPDAEAGGDSGTDPPA